MRCVLTCEHALVDDTVSADEDSVTLHDTSVPRHLEDVSRYEQVWRDVLVLYILTCKAVIHYLKKEVIAQ